MVRKTLFCLLALLFVFAIFSFISCEKSSELEGKWAVVSGNTNGKPKDLELFKDGTGVWDSVSITWKVQNERLVISSSLPAFACNYKVSGLLLNLAYDDGTSATFVKQSKEKGLTITGIDASYNNYYVTAEAYNNRSFTNFICFDSVIPKDAFDYNYFMLSKNRKGSQIKNGTVNLIGYVPSSLIPYTGDDTLHIRFHVHTKENIDDDSVYDESNYVDFFQTYENINFNNGSITVAFSQFSK